jgi:hypothetical protein
MLDNDACGFGSENIRRSLSHCKVSVTLEPTDRPPVRSSLRKAISELKGLQELLHSDEIDPQILADFPDALNRVRNTAWAAQQYANRKESDQDSTDIFAFLARERIRATYHLCQAVNEDLKQTDIQFQMGQPH